MNRQNEQRYRDMILSRGSTADAGACTEPSEVGIRLEQRGLEETSDEQ